MSDQEPQNWKTFLRAADADTSMSCLDSAAPSRQAYLIAYGRRDSEISWSIAEHIDSAKFNQMVQKQNDIDGVNKDNLIDLMISTTMLSSTKIDLDTVIKG